MDYRRYALGTYGRIKWIECTDCGNADKPNYVWQGHERAVNFSFLVNAVMQHEIAAHASMPQRSKR